MQEWVFIVGGRGWRWRRLWGSLPYDYIEVSGWNTINASNSNSRQVGKGFGFILEIIPEEHSYSVWALVGDFLVTVAGIVLAKQQQLHEDYVLCFCQGELIVFFHFFQDGGA